MRHTKMFFAALLTIVTANYGCSGNPKPENNATAAQAQALRTCPYDPENAILPDDVAGYRKTAFATSQVYMNLQTETQNKQVLSEGPFDLNDLYGFIESDLTGVSTGVKVYFGAFTPTNCDNADLGCITNLNSLVAIFVLTREDNMSVQKDFGSYYAFNPTTKKLQALQTKTAKAWVQNYRNLLTKYGVLETETHTLNFSKRAMKNMICNLRNQQQSNSQITSFNIYWGAYDKDVILWDGTTKNVKGRLTMMLQVPNAEKRLLHADNHKSYFDTSVSYANKRVQYKKDDEAFFDTAVPCPPGENCDTGDDIP